jgi:hypothetical protein
MCIPYPRDSVVAQGNSTTVATRLVGLTHMCFVWLRLAYRGGQA